MKVLLTGSNGMVGTELKKQLSSGSFSNQFECPDLDVTDEKKTHEIVQRLQPNVIVHLAAKTNVDWCEQNPEKCYGVNVEGTRNICEIADKISASLVYPSTFYVYPGDRESPYDERVDKVVPEKIVGIYSKSKWGGELVVTGHPNLNYIIPRFGALFGGGKEDKKFVSKVAGMVKSGIKEIKMINDRIIQPSSVKDTVNNLLVLMKKGGCGIFNMVGHGQATYYEYAKAILEFCGVTDVKVIPISSDSFKESAPRPKKLTAVNGRLSEMGLDLMRDWKISLKEYIEEFKTELLS